MTSSWFFLSTLNYDARSTTHQINKNMFITCSLIYDCLYKAVSISGNTASVVRRFVDKNVETICKQAQIILGNLYGETGENYKVLESAQPVFR